MNMRHWGMLAWGCLSCAHREVSYLSADEWSRAEWEMAALLSHVDQDPSCAAAAFSVERQESVTERSPYRTRYRIGSCTPPQTRWVLCRDSREQPHCWVENP